MYALIPLRAALVADTVAASIIASSSTTVVNVANAAPWANVEWVNFTGSGATLANNRAVRRIIATDTAADTLTLDRALSVAPAAGDIVGGGFVEWTLPAADSTKDLLYYVTREDDHPGLDLLRADATEKRCVTCYGEIVGKDVALAAGEERYRIRTFCRSNSWAIACQARIRTLFHARRGALTIPGRRVYSIEASDSFPVFRTDVLQEKHTRIAVVTVEAA